LRHAVLAHGPILAAPASLTSLGKNLRERFGQAEAHSAAGRGFAQQAQIFLAQCDGCADLLRGCSITLP
jgi:hypothetical protein